MLPLLLLGMQIDASVCKVILVIYICMLISIIKLVVYVPTDIREGAGNVMLDDSDSDDDYPIHFQGRGKWHLKLLEKVEKGSCHHRKTTKSYSGNRFCCIKWYYEMILWAILQFYNMSLMSCARYTTWNPLWLQGITAKKIVTKQFLAVLAFWGQCFCWHMTSYIYST